jgi:uncharacterized membrane protein YczE
MMWLRYLCSGAIGWGTVEFAITGGRWAVVVVLVALYLRILLADYAKSR